MSYLALAKQVAARLDQQKREGLASLPHVLGSLGVSEIDPALLQAEETLFRLWWRTLPNKTMAKESWEAEVAYYSAKKGFSEPFLEALKARIGDLR